MSMHLTHPLPDPRQYEPNLSEGICRVLRKMMAKERDERYLDAASVDQDLYRLQIGEMPIAEEPSVSGIATMTGEGKTSALIAPLASGRGATPPPFGTRPAGTAPPPRPRTAAAAASPAAPATPAPTTAAPAAFREEDLNFVSVELAKHIGPLARVLVKKAAKFAPNLVALGAALADNIADEEERRAFRAAVRARAN